MVDCLAHEAPGNRGFFCFMRIHKHVAINYILSTAALLIFS
jgi:hypothetical protein